MPDLYCVLIAIAFIYILFSPGQKHRYRECKEGQNGGLTCSELFIQCSESDLSISHNQVYL